MSDFEPVGATFSSLSYLFGQAVRRSPRAEPARRPGGSVSLSYPFTPAFGCTVNIAYRENEFTGIGGAPPVITTGGSNTRTDKVLAGTIRVSYQLLRWLGTSLDYSYSLTDSSDFDGEIKENRVRLSLNFAF